MKIFKRVISLMLCIALLTATFSACSTFNLNNIDSAITKGEWIETLGAHFGFQSEKDSEPYFKDVSKDDDGYNYIQASVDHGIISAEENFNPSSKVTREYVFATAVKAVGNDITKLEDNSSDKVAAKKAYELGLAKSKSWKYMHEGITEEEAEEISKQASILFCGKEIADHDNTKLQDNVKVQENTENLIIDTVHNKVTVKENAENQPEYSIGDIVVFGTGADIKQYKITGVSNDNGELVYETEIPTIDEVYDEIDVAGVGVLEDASDIQCADGVELIGFNGVELVDTFKEVTASSLGLANSDNSIVNTDAETKSDSNFKISLKFGSDGKPEVSASTDSIGNGETEFSIGSNKEKGNAKDYDISKSVDGKSVPLNKDGLPVDEKGNTISKDLISKYEEQKITEYKNGNTKTVTTGKEYKKGWKLTGEIEFSNMQPQVDVKTKKGFLGVITGFESFEIVCNPTTNVNIAFEGYTAFEKTIVKVAYSVGPITIEGAINMKLDTNGQISFNMTFKQNNRVSYTSDNGFVKTCNSEQDFQPSINASIKWTPISISLSLKLGWFKIIGVSLDIAIEASIKLSGTFFVYSKEGLYKMGGDEAMLQDAQLGFLFCREYKIVLPIIELKIGGDADPDSLAAKVGLSYTWKIMAEKGGLINSPVLGAHCEGSAFNNVKTCTLEGLKPYEYKNLEEAKKDEHYDENTTSPDAYNSFELNTYAVDLAVGEESSIEFVNFPKGYSAGDVEWEISDQSIINLSKIDPGNNKILVKGVKSGIATITFKIPDGSEQAVTVIVSE